MKARFGPWGLGSTRTLQGPLIESLWPLGIWGILEGNWGSR